MINKLVKIGGALVNSKENFLKLIELISSDDYNNSFFVISGFGKTTNKLRFAAGPEKRSFGGTGRSGPQGRANTYHQ